MSTTRQLALMQALTHAATAHIRAVQVLGTGPELTAATPTPLTLTLELTSPHASFPAPGWSAVTVDACELNHVAVRSAAEVESTSTDGRTRIFFPPLEALFEPGVAPRDIGMVLAPTSPDATVRAVVIEAGDRRSLALRIIDLGLASFDADVAAALGAAADDDVVRVYAPWGFVGWYVAGAGGADDDDRPVNADASAVLGLADVVHGHVVVALEEPWIGGRVFGLWRSREREAWGAAAADVARALEAAPPTMRVSVAGALAEAGVGAEWVGRARRELDGARERMVALVDAAADAAAHMLAATWADVRPETPDERIAVALDVLSTALSRDADAPWWRVGVKVLVVLRQSDAHTLTERELQLGHSLRKSVIDLTLIRAVCGATRITVTSQAKMALVRGPLELERSHLASVPGVDAIPSSALPAAVAGPSSPAPSLSPSPQRSPASPQAPVSPPSSPLAESGSDEWEVVDSDDATATVQCFEPLNGALQAVLAQADGSGGRMVVDDANTGVDALVAALVRVLVDGVRGSRLSGGVALFGRMGAKVGARLDASSRTRTVVKVLAGGCEAFRVGYEALRGLGVERDAMLPTLVRMGLVRGTLRQALVAVYGLSDPVAMLRGARAEALQHTYLPTALLCNDDAREVLLHFLDSLEPITFAIGIRE